MKVLIINQHRADVVGGSEVQCDLIARGLAERGHEVTYGVMRPRGRAAGEGYRCLDVPSPTLSGLRRLFAEARPEVVYWRFNKHHFLPAALLARLHGATFLFALSHDHDPLFWPPRPSAPGEPLRRRLRRALTRLEDTVNWGGRFFVDGWVAQHKGQAAVLPPARTRLIHNSVLTEGTAFEWPRPWVAWVGNLKPRKRPEAFLELAAA